MVKIETFSSGGGCYHAQLRIGDVIWVVTNDGYDCLTCYDIEGKDETYWFVDNMIYSKNISVEDFTLEETAIYTELYGKLKADYPNVNYCAFSEEKTPRFNDIKISGRYYSDEEKALYVVEPTEELVETINSMRKEKGFTDLVTDNTSKELHYNFSLYSDLNSCEAGLCGYCVGGQGDDGEPYDIELSDEERENITWKLVEYMQMLTNRAQKERKI